MVDAGNPGHVWAVTTIFGSITLPRARLDTFSNAALKQEAQRHKLPGSVQNSFEQRALQAYVDCSSFGCCFERRQSDGKGWYPEIDKSAPSPEYYGEAQ